MTINPNLEALKPSATLAINQQVLRLRKEGRTIYHFGFGQSPFPIHHSIVNALRKHAKNNAYLPSTGLSELKVAIASFLKNHLQVAQDPTHIYIGPGSKELLYQTILLLEATFLIPKGSWVSYVPQIKSKGGKYAILETDFKNNYKLTAPILEAYCTANPEEEKVLILNSPNNPTGAVYDQEELIVLAQICKKYRVLVLADEIYSLFHFGLDNHKGMGFYYPEGTITYGGLSKIFSAGGYRLGFMALPKRLYPLHKVFRSLFSETFSAVASPIQYAAIKAFEMSSELSQTITLEAQILKTVATYVFNRLQKMGVACTRPQGGFYLVIDLNVFRSKFERKNIFHSPMVSQWLLENAEVALLPGSDFYFEETNLVFRLAFVDFDGAKALKVFAQYQNDPEQFVVDHCPNIYQGLKRLEQQLMLL